MARSRNQVGTAYALTVFAPVLDGRLEVLRGVLDALPRGEASPLARLDTLHYSRLQLFEELVPPYGAPRERHERLPSPYLVFTSSVDGTLDAYLDALCERVGVEADGWWGHCSGYPGTADRSAFGRWIRDHQVDTSLFVAAYPRASVAEVRTALHLRERLTAFAIEAQGLDAADLQDRFRATFATGSWTTGA